ncbi:outer membrane protein assembly factor BamE [Coxiella endosymbiont of Dermacentor marginatus]|uniref:outer membrane protein assembly factor BamE n=1 Tax=Coxiella endosymbiont of Dermacentor marginatus TaxID=1656159 RepID=UPI0022235BE0|nr:outer membrane protein assembly factor BamE [Coxiella endosymbiont of Dermacentor marginatus]
MRRATLIFLVYLIITLEGCVYHPPIQQGNIFSDKDLSTLYKGMTKDQVRAILADPVLVNIFSDNRMVYVYTFQHGRRQRMQLTHLIICLHNNHVTDFWIEKTNH